MAHVAALTDNSFILDKKKRRRMKKIEQWSEMFYSIFRAPSAKFGGVFLLIIVLSCVFAPLIAPYQPFEMDLQHIYASPMAGHIFGTDSLGRDLFSRLLYGGRYSLMIGLFGAVIGSGIGVVFGSVAGYFGGQIENLIMRFCDIWSAIPGMLLMILISSALGSGLFNTVLAISIGGIPMGARMTRGQIMAERSKEYLEAAECINCSKINIMFSHLLPNVIAPTIVNAAMQVGGAITMASGLSYLGLGIQPPTPEWGALLSEGTSSFQLYPYLLIFPGIFLGVSVLCINLVGDGIRDALDPKLRN